MPGKRYKTDHERILRNVTTAPSGCWEWQSTRSRGGYGRVLFNGKQWQAHRVAYELFVGPIPDGLEIDHLCRIRHCVNPQHLGEPVTRSENLLRSPITLPSLRAAKGECLRGHVFDSKNTTIRPTGHRSCRECHRIHDRAHRIRKQLAAANVPTERAA